METKIETIYVNGDRISVQLLGPGDILEATDLYDSSSGKFQPCPCPGLQLMPAPRSGTAR